MLPMLNIYQKTISESTTFKGVGLHSGKNSTVKITPAKENNGIIFKKNRFK